MAANANKPSGPAEYEVRVEGHLDNRWADWVEGVTLTHEADGSTTLRALLPDQPALHGVLARMRDLGVPVISVCRLGDDAGVRRELMQAIVQDAYGTADQLRLAAIEKPAIRDHEVLVRVHAAGVDAGVWHLMTGLPYLVRLGFGLRGPKHPVSGMDLAGRVEAVGAAVTRFRVGDEVFGSGVGAFAEYAAVAEDKLARKPPNISWEQAASVGNSSAAALKALRDMAQVQPGQKVLVIGASGGVGSYAVQIATALGAEVTGVASTSKVDLVRSLGAVDVIDYTREEITARGVRYDVIVDIAGNRPLSTLRRALATDGTLVIAGGEGGGKLTGGIDRQIRAQVLSAFVSQKLRFFISTVSADDIELIARMLEEGTVVPSVDRAFPLAKAADAVRYFESGQARGKVTITV